MSDDERHGNTGFPGCGVTDPVTVLLSVDGEILQAFSGFEVTVSVLLLTHEKDFQSGSVIPAERFDGTNTE